MVEVAFFDWSIALAEQDAVREVEEVVDTSFVEELERASITRPMEQQQSTRSSGKASAASGGVRGSRGRGRAGKARGWIYSREDEGVDLSQEDCEEWEAEIRYRECMSPLQVLSAARCRCFGDLLSGWRKSS